MTSVTYLIKELCTVGLETGHKLLANSPKQAFELVKKNHYHFYRIFAIYESSVPKKIAEETPNHCKEYNYKLSLDRSQRDTWGTTFKLLNAKNLDNKK